MPIDLRDELVVLTLQKSVSTDDAVTKRLQEKLNSQNAHGNRHDGLSLSLGVAHHDPEHPCSIDELLAKADLSMYQRKRGLGREWKRRRTSQDEHTELSAEGFIGRR